MVFPIVALPNPPETMICTNLNLQYFRKLLCKSELFWFYGSWEKDCYMTPPHFCDYLPFEEDLALDFYNFKSPLPKGDLYQVWLKFACWFPKRFFTIFSVFSLFRYYLSLGKGVVHHLYNSESPLPTDDLCQLWLKLAQWFWRRSLKCKSFTDRQTDRQMTDNRRSEIQLSWANYKK
jgi:hypothetical protein